MIELVTDTEHNINIYAGADNTWIKHFPEHKNNLKETVIHHHVDQGQVAIPVPASTHVGSGGFWHTK
ncbi:hypothetical protein [Rubellicoccus peritrichatus]|uniref:Tox-HNH-HHH domain-containing protein n=1 Tax=Rubellicoccus peritrichatus TaxID=3080537 RepID=A0AAQ3LDV5_9BACT|nr:hypothetical protein [Puniceicoccus sp. CR14]WOO42624.1 hypothetical protein RZN69_05935 [Puniceicoccus sp. CR14]